MCELSIIVPVYNVEQYIEACVKSILNQDYKDFEILLIDDGSLDDSGKICDVLAKKYTPIFAFHKENGGLSSARNYGIKKARGKYISFIDSDDTISQGVYSKVISQMKQNQSDIGIFGVKIVRKNQYKSYYTIKNDETITKEEAFQKMFVELYFGEEAWNKIYRRSLFQTIRYPENKKHEDTFTTYKLIHQAKKISLISDVYYYYYQRNDSIMGKLKTSYTTDKLESINKVLQFLKENYFFIFKEALYNLLSACQVNLDIVVHDTTNEEARVYLQMFKNIYKNNMKYIIFNSKISFKQKIMLLVPGIFPTIWCFICKRRKN